MSAINLLPDRNRFHFSLYVLVFLSAIFLGLFSWRFLLQREIDGFVKRLLYLQKELESAPVLSSSKLIRKGQGANLEKERGHFVTTLQKILNNIPADLYLTKLSIRNFEVTINGRAKYIFSIREFIKKISQNEVAPIVKLIAQEEQEFNFSLLWASIRP